MNWRTDGQLKPVKSKETGEVMMYYYHTAHSGECTKTAYNGKVIYSLRDGPLPATYS